MRLPFRLTNILIGLCSVFFLLSHSGESIPSWILSLTGLNSYLFFEGAFWLPFTYFLLFDNVLGFVSHMLILFFLGRILEVRLGFSAYLKLVGICIVVPGLVYLIFEPILIQRSLLESTPLVIGLLASLAILNPNQIVLLFFLPLPMRLLLLITILMLALLQIAGLLSVAAHLSYMSALFLGLIYTRAWLRKNSIYTRGHDPYQRY